MKQWKLSANTQNLMYVAMIGLSLLGVGNAFLASMNIKITQLIPLLLPLLALAGYGVWWVLQSRHLLIDGANLIFKHGAQESRYPFKEVTLSYGRFTYPNMGAYGTTIFVKAPKKTLRFAIPQLLFSAEEYTEPDGYSHDFLMTEPEGRALHEALLKAIKANTTIRLEPESAFRGGEQSPNIAGPQPLSGGYRKDFRIELRRREGLGQIAKFVAVMMLGVLLLNVIILGLEPYFGMATAQGVGMVLFVPSLLYFIFSMMKGSSADYILQLKDKTLTLSSTKKNKIEAKCTREEVSIEKGHYNMTTKGGSFTFPVLSLSFPGKKPLAISTHLPSAWGKGGRNMGTPSHMAGPPEFELLRTSFGINNK